MTRPTIIGSLVNSPMYDSLADVLASAPRLSFGRAALDVLTEVGGVLAIWRNDELLHVEATDDLSFEVHLVRHGLNGRSRFLSRLFDEVLWPEASREGNGWNDGGLNAATKELVQDQLTYSVQVIGMDLAAIETCTSALTRRMRPTSPAEITWSDGWRLPSEIMA